MKLLGSRYAQIGLALVVAVLLITAFSSSAAAAGPVYHTVHYGQTLYSIAQHYGTSVWAIACANGLYNPNYVYAGQVLLIPYGGHDGCKPGHKPYDKPDYGYDHKDGYDNVGHNGGYDRKDGYDHKDGYGHDGGYDKKESYDHKGGYGCGPCGQPAKWQPEPKKFGCYYTVRWGDHLYRIALKYGVSWTVIAHANGLYNANYIYAGQVLRVPCVW
jgi:LysM repeat protein